MTVRSFDHSVKAGVPIRGGVVDEFQHHIHPTVMLSGAKHLSLAGESGSWILRFAQDDGDVKSMAPMAGADTLPSPIPQWMATL